MLQIILHQFQQLGVDIASVWADYGGQYLNGMWNTITLAVLPAMLMALETGTVDFVCTDMPTAKAAVAAYDDMVILDFSGTDGDFQFTDEERAEKVNIGISMKKGNTELKDAINSVLSTMTAEDFEAIMDEAVSVQPLSK